MAKWNPSKHPRDSKGRFTHTTGGLGSSVRFSDLTPKRRVNGPAVVRDLTPAGNRRKKRRRVVVRNLT